MQMDVEIMALGADDLHKLLQVLLVAQVARVEVVQGAIFDKHLE